MQAIRLVFDQTGDKLKFRSAKKLVMRVPPEQKIANLGWGSGTWIEVRSKKKIPLYRRVIDSSMLLADTEIRTGTSDKPLARRAGSNIRNVFNAVIPDLEAAVTFHIFHQEQGKEGGKPTEIVKVDLSKI